MQVGIKECDRNLLLIRWWKEKEDGTWETMYYRFHRLPWGIISAPFVLNAVVRYLYDKYAEKFPEYLDDISELKRSTYVDDILAFGKTDEEAHKRMTLAIDALEAGQMHVTKFRSHPSSIADELCKKDRYWKEGEKTPETFKVLGIWYNSSKDEIWSAFEHLHDFDTKPHLRKRHLAGIVARIFDTLGMLSHFTLMSKFLWQDYIGKKSKGLKGLRSKTKGETNLVQANLRC